MKTRLITLSFAILAAALLVSSAQAQRHVAFASGRGGGRSHFGRGHRFGGSAYAPYYYYADDYDAESGPVDAPRPQIIVPAAPPAAPPNPPESLVIEWSGDRWVRLTSRGPEAAAPVAQVDQRGPERASSQPAAASRPAPASEPATPLPPAVLVFRDGHHEEMAKYTIVGSTIYTSSDYWTSGSWTRKVQIAELNVPATLKVNQERGAKFALPSSPNEVIFRP
jgi:hypothetical protein